VRTARVFRSYRRDVGVLHIACRYRGASEWLQIWRCGKPRPSLQGRQPAVLVLDKKEIAAAATVSPTRLFTIDSTVPAKHSCESRVHEWVRMRRG
jgi:hypothetical protein